MKPGDVLTNEKLGAALDYLRNVAFEAPSPLPAPRTYAEGFADAREMAARLFDDEAKRIRALKGAPEASHSRPEAGR